MPATRLRTRLRAALIATTVATAVLAPAAAFAGSTTVTDGTGDVWEDVYDDSTGTETFVAADSVDNVDLVSTKITHGDYKVTIVMTYNELKKSGAGFESAVQMRFDSGPKRVVLVDAHEGAWKGTHMVFKDSANSNGPVACSGFTHTIDYAADTVTMSVPRGCLGKPRWIESNILAIGFRTDDTGAQHTYVDQGAAAGHAFTKWGQRLKKG